MAMTNLFSNMSIRFKLSIGAGVFIFILSILGVLVYVSEQRVLKSVTKVVHDAQPRVLQAVKMSEDIKDTVGAFSLYLLSEEQSQKNDYENKVANIDAQIVALKEKYVALNQQDRIELVDKISATFDEIKGHNVELAKFVGNVSLRIPGQSYAAGELGPLTQEALSLLSNIANGEFEDEEAMQMLHQIDQLWLSWTRMSSEIRAYLTFRTKTLEQNVLDFHELISNKQLALLDSGDLELDQEEAFERLVEIAKAFRPKLLGMFEIHSGENWRADVAYIRSKVLPLQLQLDSLIGELTELENKAITETSELLVNDVNQAGGFSLSLVLIGIILGSVIMLLAITVVTRRINATVSALEDIAYGSGDLDQRLDDGGNDEISRLAVAYNTFVSAIQDVVNEVVKSASSLDSESGQINRSMVESQQQVARQAQDLDRIEEAVDHMADSSGQVSDNAQSASTAAEAANNFASEGQNIVQRMLTAISTLSSEVEDTTRVVQQVEAQSEQIGMVLGVIRNISEQTNLLALNAAIEAARAGEQGRGFAVVADEVRTLSEKIHLETDEIQSIIQKLQDGAKHAVASMETGLNSTRTTVEMAGNANNALLSISETINTIVEMNNGIAVLTGQQAASTEDIRSKVHSINESAGETQKTVESAQTSTQTFGEMAGNLNSLVEQFTRSQG